MATIEGVEVVVDAEAVIVTAETPLTVLSSAVIGGGLGLARSIVNLHVDRGCPADGAEANLRRIVDGRRLPAPWVGLLTAAMTERAEVGAWSAGGLQALVVATVGLSNVAAAGWSAAAPALAGTINTVVIVDARVEPAALVNLALTVTEVKTLVLAEAGVRCPDGTRASGTSTDAVVVAATGRGVATRFGGPVSQAGWVVARAARAALTAGVRRWLDASG
jgi:iron complex transport system ATP-binding protein